MPVPASQQWFDRVYTETLPVVRRCAYAFLKSYPDLSAEADDLIQETYIRMFQAQEQLHSRPEIIKWLIATLRNLVSIRLRVRKTRVKHHIMNTDNDTILEFYASNQYGDVDSAFVNEDQERLNKIAARLGADKLELLSEYYLDKVPLSVLAERENISTDAMKMRISRLHKKCMEILVVILLFHTLLSRGFLHIGGEGHGNQYQEEVLFRTRCADSTDGRDEQACRSDGYFPDHGMLIFSIPRERRRRSRIH